jgi:hypothetical protein
MYVFRIHIRPNGGLDDPKYSFNYCTKNSLLGAGWQIEKQNNEIIDWETYEKRGSNEHDNISVVRYIKSWVSKDDLVWTRDTNGQYYIAKVLSPWEYFDNEEARKADIVNVFKVEMHKIKTVDEVPGKVIASFRAGRTIQEVADEPAKIHTKYLWNRLKGKNEYEINEKADSVWSLLNNEQVEDLLFIYLQTKGWYVIPGSRKGDTMSYEFILINKDNFLRGIVQAKTGYSTIDIEKYNHYSEEIFFFQTHGSPTGQLKKNYHILAKEEIEIFVRNNSKLIPRNIL